MKKLIFLEKSLATFPNQLFLNKKSEKSEISLKAKFRFTKFACEFREKGRRL